MTVALEAVQQLVESVWAQVLGMNVDLAGEAQAGGRDGWLLGRIEIRGAWQGVVLLACPATLTRRAAGVMFDTPPQEISDEQAQDALAELTNILGGNLKALLPGPSALGLPVVEEPASAEAPPHGSTVFQAAFRCQDEPLVLAVLGRGGDGAAVARVEE
jgi:chemotaxis protein CheX